MHSFADCSVFCSRPETAVLCAVKDEMIWRDEVFAESTSSKTLCNRCFLQLATTYDVQTVKYIFIFKS